MNKKYLKNNNYKQLHDIEIKFKKGNNQFNHKLVEQIKELEKTIEQRTNFFINFAHEAKIDLTLIGSYLNLLDNQLRRKSNDKEIIQNLDIIQKSYKNIQEDIVNFLDLKKLEKGQILYNNNNSIELKSFIEKKIELFKENAQLKNIKIIPLLNKAYINIDPFAMDRIMNNLLDNAIKYNKENGSIKIILKIENEKVILSISDTGIGMESEQIKNLYNPFSILSSSGINQHGMGIGLSIVNHLIKQLGGEIKVESKKNEGSKFTIIFLKSKTTDIKTKTTVIEPKKNNYVTSKSVIPLNTHLLSKRYSPNLPTIFVVDDDVELLEYLQVELFEIFNFYHAKNGLEAMEKIEKIPKPDIIISDIMMDKMNGYEFKNKLYEKTEYRAIPFIFLSALSTHNDKIHGLVKGAINYITKPFNIGELFVTISSIIDLTKLQKKINIEEFQKKLSILLNEQNNINFDENNNFEYICYTNNISNSEKEIIKLILQGKENKEIADRLYKSFNTIRNQTQSILKKFNIKNKKELFKLFKNI